MRNTCDQRCGSSGPAAIVTITNGTPRHLSSAAPIIVKSSQSPEGSCILIRTAGEYRRSCWFGSFSRNIGASSTTNRM